MTVTQVLFGTHAVAKVTEMNLLLNGIAVQSLHIVRRTFSTFLNGAGVDFTIRSCVPVFVHPTDIIGEVGAL